MKRIESILVKLILSVAILLGVASCGTEPGGSNGGDSVLVTNVQPEATMLLQAGKDYRIMATGAQQDDILLLEGPKTYECAMARLSTTWFRFAVPEDIVAGKYSFTLRRGEQTQFLFSATVTVQEFDNKVASKLDQGYNLKGMVYCNKKGVKDVLVTDGVEFTKTDANGHYWLKSKKAYEVVYLVLPTGYNVPTQAAMPRVWAQTSSDTTSEEQHDFELIQASTDNHTILVVTDVHLTNRNLKPNDCIQFRDGCVAEMINDYTGKENVYCLNLGDFAHDIHWYKHSIGWAPELEHHPTDYISALPFQFWSTLGNHDHDGHTPKGSGDSYDIDLRASGPFRKMVGPSHISMNIGKVHYMLLDDIIYYNGYTGSNSNVDALFGDCNYFAGFRDDMLEWVKKDLSYVSKDTPILVGMHIPLANWSGSARNGEFTSNSHWQSFINLFKDYKEVDFITGHTHQTRFRPIPGYGSNIYEHNMAATSGVWWNTSQFTGGTINKRGALSLSADGTPAGYYVYEVSGTNRTWRYKYVGENANKQFKSYDMNEVKKFFDTYGPATTYINAGSFTNTAHGNNSAYTISKTEYGYNEDPNVVWINVWAWENGSFAHHGNWEITVTEDGKQLDVQQFNGGRRDLMSALTYEIPKYSEGKSFSATSASSTSHNHMFRVVASKANSTLIIKVKDRFGRVYQETMTRPKKFYDGNDISKSWTLD